MPSPAKPSLLAIHEAAHAVVALFCDFNVSRLTIRQEGDAFGSCFFHMPAAASPIVVAAVFLAGYLAVRLVDPYVSAETASWDLAEAEKLLPPGADLGELVSRVRRRVYSLWDEIHRLAEALDREKTLIGADHIRNIARLPSWARG